MTIKEGWDRASDFLKNYIVREGKNVVSWREVIRFLGDALEKEEEKEARTLIIRAEVERVMMGRREEKRSRIREQQERRNYKCRGDRTHSKMVSERRNK